ncbi:MAG: GNAT family N-acetyltransferase [Actinophytocola sp.]|uniref:GNAT family N-acetyltransferase n=1 Tax=Actinophytocola sp. TaxID=1872138 RepID=UPI0013288A74|nr:GNAT family N-acetyltransferase [Actinophytocola sp.]MPZ84995.1 GNAT family N-acetyltransferase [Actinophytocola sp.]
MIRLARPDDLPALVDIERSAGEPFRAIGMALVADDDPGTVEDLAPYQEDGRAWVSTDADDRPVGYLLAEVVDGHAHIEQVSVRPTHGRRGLGRQLIETAREWALARGFDTVSLTTYAEVPWNGPYYARLGFEVLAPDRLTPGLREIRAREAAKGLDAWPRVTMVLPARSDT